MLKLYVNLNRIERTVGLYFLDECRGDNRIFAAKPIILEMVDVTEAHTYKPTLTLSRDVSIPFLKSMRESLDEYGIKGDNDFKIKGLLEAQKYHLEDLRKLLKLIN